MASVDEISAAATAAGITDPKAIIAFSLGFSAGASQPELRDSPSYDLAPAEKAEPNVLYGHPVSGNCLGAFLYVADHDLGVSLQLMDIMAGKQMADWFIALNPNHAVPTMTDDKGNGIWESGVVLRKLAGYAGETVSDKVAMAMDYRQTSMYQHCGKIYMPYLFTPDGTVAQAMEGVTGLKEKIEPTLINFFLSDGKFIGGGDTPSVADYSIVPVLTMLPPYLEVADARIKKYVEDFKAASKSWEKLGAAQSGFVQSVKDKKGTK